MPAAKRKAVEVLRAVQLEIRAPKNQYNSFSDYSYRSAEDICTALKPLADRHKFTLVTPVEMVHLGDRFYAKATARFMVDGDQIETTAFAREALYRKKFDEAQLTGSAHSYAVKYALTALLLLDDTKDADTRPPVLPLTDINAEAEFGPEIHGAKSRIELTETYKRAHALHEQGLVSKEFMEWTRDRCSAKASVEGWSSNGSEQSTDG